MRKLVLSLFMVAVTTVAMAQFSDRPMRWQGFETNRFWDNWEMSLAGGNSFLLVSENLGEDPGKFLDRNGWNANVGFTKWVAPIIGMRLQLDAGEFRNYSFNQSLYGSDAFKTPYMFVHGDILINMSNWIAGYRPDRVYYAISYVGFGYTAMSWTKKSAGSYNGEFAFSSGLINKFRVSPQWDIELDLRSWLFAEKSLPKEIQGDGRYAFGLSASLGVAYRFNQRDWTPAYSQVDVDGYLAAIIALEERLAVRDIELVNASNEIATLDSKNKSLEADIAKCKSKNSQPQPHPKSVSAPESVIFFTIGDAKITDYAEATLETYLEQVKDTNSPISIVGYADKETGSTERNEQLSKERAENVATWLMNAGIDALRITVHWVGDSETAFTSPETPLVNRCVIIK